MEEMVLLIVALGALTCMTANVAMTMKILFSGKKQEPREQEKTMEELEAERKRLEQQRLELEGRENMMAYSGFLWKDGGRQ